MTTNRLIIILATLTLGMQAAILYRQYAGTSARPAPPVAVRDAINASVIEISGLPIRGSKNASVALIEFSDYECPFCERHANGVGKQIEEAYVSTGRVLLAFVNNPLPMHTNARFLATTAICAGVQRRYWEMHDAIFAKKPRTRAQVMTVASDVGLDLAEFQQCLEGQPETTGRIEQDLQVARAFGLTATPAFAVGMVDRDGRVSVLKLISGAQPRDVFEKTLNDLLAKADRS